MPALYPAIEPYESGYLEVGDGNSIYWECCGSPAGKAAVVLHGGPGSGCTPRHRRLFDPARYRVVLFDQRNCGRSRQHPSEPDVDLATNATQALVGDIERLREQLGVEQWLVLGGSWGSTLALAYGEAHAERVSELVLFGVTAGQHAEVDRVFRGGLASKFPAQWERLRAFALEGASPRGDGAAVVEAIHARLFAADPAVREQAAYEWCLWESASPDWPPRTELAPRFRDAAYALAFARIVTHYARHDMFLEDSALLDGAARLAAVPAVLINGEHDAQTTDAAEQLARRLPFAEYAVVPDAGHAASNEGIASAIVAATDRFASS
jgi:proline iminopeptidase